MKYDIDYQARGGDENTSPWHDRASIVMNGDTPQDAIRKLKSRIRQEEPSVTHIRIDEVMELRE